MCFQFLFVLKAQQVIECSGNYISPYGNSYTTSQIITESKKNSTSITVPLTDNIDWLTTGNFTISGGTLTTNANVTPALHASVALFKGVSNATGMEFKLDSRFSNVRPAFGIDEKNFVFLNAAGDVWEIINGVLGSAKLLSSSAITFNATDVWRIERYGHSFNLFQNNVLVKTFNPAVVSNWGTNPIYMGFAFRSNASTDTYSASNLKISKRNYKKYVHFSLDDFILTLKDLTDKVGVYSSIFDNPLLKSLKTQHDTYGMVTSCYLFNKTAGFALASMTAAYKAEFIANASWLKFGFHADTTSTNYDPGYSTVDAQAQYEYCYQNVKRFAGTECFDRIPRIHFFKASIDVVKAWQSSLLAPAPLGFLTADDARTSNYYLSGQQLTATYNGDVFQDDVNNLSFFRTDMRLENDANPASTILSRSTNPLYSGQQETFIIFTHEPLLSANLSKLQALNAWFALQGYDFDYPQNRIFESLYTIDLKMNKIDKSVVQVGNILTANESNASYQWLDCDNSFSPLAGQTSQSFTPTLSGNYAVEITKNGCKEISVTTQITLAGVDQELNNELKLYPNPFRDFINIEKNNDDTEYSIKIINLQAVVIFQKTFIGRKITLDIRFLASGSYVIKVGGRYIKFIKT